jgi:hypothetical protein
VLLGNPAAKEAWRDEDGNLHHHDVDGPRVTTIEIPSVYSPVEAFAVVTAQEGVWNNHTQGDNPGDVKPDWVECDDETLLLLLKSHYGCPVGRPKSWKGLG